MSDPAGTVLITRPSPAAEETALHVAALGLLPVVTPLLTIRRLPAVLPPDAAAVLVTSSNAIDGLPAWARARPVLAVGDATAARARAAGFPNVHSADGNSTDLAALVQRMFAPAQGELLLLTGKGQGTALAELLQAQQHVVVLREVYEAAPVPVLPEPAAAALQSRDLQAALFFSTETARLFVRLVTEDRLETSVRNTNACAISPAAGVALNPLPWRRIRIAARPTQDDMLALLR